jgi:hypothetical protein
MTEWLEYFFSELGAIFLFSLIFGGFVVLPVFALWIYLVFRLTKPAYFLGAWIPLLIVSVILVMTLLWGIRSTHQNFGDRSRDLVGGPISPFPNLDPSVVLVTIPAFSAFLSPLLIMFVLYSWKRYRKSQQPLPPDSL